MPADASHLLVCQDDALPQPNFHERMTKAIEAHPEAVLLAFVPGFRWLLTSMVEARHKGDAFAPYKVGAFVPLVATSFPRSVVTGLLDWADNGRGDRYRRPIRGADDGVVAWYMRLRRIHPLMLVPSIVDHDDDVPSVGKHTRGGPHRRAAMLLEIGGDDDASVTTCAPEPSCYARASAAAAAGESARASGYD